MDTALVRRLQERLLAQAHESAPDDWLPVVIADAVCGVASPDVASFLASKLARCLLLDYQLVFDDGDLDVRTRSALLHEAALRLHDAGLVWGWRNELLDVRPDPDAAPLATIERCACRALGITTIAVHLNAFTPDGRLWIARRAAHKQIDPGLLDNLVGGMVPAGETESAALLREGMEEAGLDLAPHPLARGGRVRVTRVVPEGYQSELVQVFDTTLPAKVQPRNQDGEVAEIKVRDVDSVLAAIERDEFTLESALVTLDTLMRRADHPAADR